VLLYEVEAYLTKDGKPLPSLGFRDFKNWAQQQTGIEVPHGGTGSSDVD
jgi:hypothetical protein